MGEALYIEDRPDQPGCLDLRNVADIDLVMGPRGSAAEDAFCRTLTDQKMGVNGLLAVVATNLMTKPATVMFNKVTIKGAKQAVQMLGPAQRGVAMAIADCVADGTIPANVADDVFICVGVHIPKAINIPPEMVSEIGALLPKSKTVPLVFYCRGTGWSLSKPAAVAAEKAGYRDLQIFQGGYPEWIAKGYKIAK